MQTKLVGILNITPDSFSDGGKYNTTEAALTQADELFRSGASILDVGAESTRPGSTALTADQEWQRLEPILPILLAKYPNKISLDSYHPETIQRAFQVAPVIVNDITGLSNQRMIDVVIRYSAIVIISHAPASQPDLIHTFELDDAAVIEQDLRSKAELLCAQGLSRDNIILDPGIGFGKTARLNRELLSFASRIPEYKVMIGYSRKRFLGPDRMDIALNLAAGEIAVQFGAAYLRVHDVAGHVPLVKPV